MIWRRICSCKAAARLQAISDNWDTRAREASDALLHNRKLWSIFLTSVTQQDNPLPAQVRQNVANLGIFVMNQTMSAMAVPQREKLRRAHQHQPRACCRVDGTRVSGAFDPLSNQDLILRACEANRARGHGSRRPPKSAGSSP